MAYYSIRWEKVDAVRRRPNIIHVAITCLDEEGRQHRFVKPYEEWIGVCTSRIDRVVHDIQHHFPKCIVRYERLGDAKKILPYFDKRLETGKLDYRDKPFYKVYTSAPIHDVGTFFNRYKMAYFDRNDWLVRLYVDVCTRFDTRSFYYKWYHLDARANTLLDSLCMIPDRTDPPDWTIAAFDLETVAMDGSGRIPTGIDPTDRIVAISIVKWNRRRGVCRRVLYLTPHNYPLDGISDGVHYDSEEKMLNDFHVFLQDCQVLTGYNILSFDLPCVLARLWWLKMDRILKLYTSYSVGTFTITTFAGKAVLDLYHYVKLFSGHNLSSFKLEHVAETKLNGFTKLPVHATGLHDWFTSPHVTPSLVQCTDPSQCFTVLQPTRVSESQFGTMTMYVQYCLRDSEVVHLLFEKEMTLSFLVERANFTALDMVQALHYGNSRYLLELFQTYGTRLGYCVNPKHFKNRTTQFTFGKKGTYQGALNYCNTSVTATQYFENVAVLDFTSMYPSALLNANMCYGTCALLPRNYPVPASCDVIPYRTHTDADFRNDYVGPYPAWDDRVDQWAIVVNQHTQGFLPCLVKHFIQLRQYHQTYSDVYHRNAQQCIKILINSLYGIMASKDSPLAYMDIAMSIVTLARYQLLASYHYVKRLGFDVCYADTDSLMVHRWPYDHCDPINTFLNLKHVHLKFEQRMQRLLLLSKKRYVYETEEGSLVTKGFLKRSNGLIDFMSKRIIQCALDSFRHPPSMDPFSYGWIMWVDTLQQANYMCRNPKQYSITRKTKRLSEYKSTGCAAVRILKKYPEKENDYVDYAYSRADVQAKAVSEWIVAVDDCQWVDFEHLFMSQKKIFYTVLNVAFWHLPKPYRWCQAVLNTMRWKHFLHAELLHWHTTHTGSLRASGGTRIVMLVEQGARYAFSINDHTVTKRKVVDRGTKRKIKERLENSWIPPKQP